jgi:hypothetical protein
MAHVTSAEASTYALLQLVDRLAKAVRASCLSLGSLVRGRMVRQPRDARQEHAGGLRLLTKSEMPCTQVGNSRRESRFTMIGASMKAGPQEGLEAWAMLPRGIVCELDGCQVKALFYCGPCNLFLCGLHGQVHVCGQDALFKGPEEIVSDILLAGRAAALGARHHSMMAYCDWHRVSGCKPASLAGHNASGCNDELHPDGAPSARATRFKEAVAFVKYVLCAFGSLAFLARNRDGCSPLRSVVCEIMLRQRDPLRVVMAACRERPIADEGEPWCSGKYIKDNSDTTKKSKYAGSHLKRQKFDNPAMVVKGVGWLPAWSDLRAARWMNFTDDQALISALLGDERRPAQMYAGCVVSFVAASLVLAVSLPLAAARSARL